MEGAEDAGQGSDEGDVSNPARGSVGSSWKELAFQALLDGTAACLTFSELEETLPHLAPLLLGGDGGSRCSRGVQAVAEALVRIGQREAAMADDGTACTAGQLPSCDGSSSSGSLPSSLLTFLLDHFPHELQNLKPPLLQQLLRTLDAHGCMAGLAGSPLSDAILDRVKAADFLVWLDEAPDEGHEGMARALRAMGFPMCSRQSGSLPTHPQSMDVPSPSLGMGSEPPEAASALPETASPTVVLLGVTETPPAIEAIESPEAALLMVPDAAVSIVPLWESTAPPAAPQGELANPAGGNVIESPEGARTPAREHAFPTVAASVGERGFPCSQSTTRLEPDVHPEEGFDDILMLCNVLGIPGRSFHWLFDPIADDKVRTMFASLVLASTNGFIGLSMTN